MLLHISSQILWCHGYRVSPKCSAVVVRYQDLDASSHDQFSRLIM